ncbi:hypothetical protein [Hydrogenimonas cancrithermarum]|uniref:Outer membrane protein beta-barrel domain-containing protein n=1 Tax=Hydrogenimonas cancrithermarum TaxID=2993563 RepID=A0ABN6WZ89_9BACT|nr:hypothetical protein [Hydrogenimonas cancrithermarum]BDY13694.1 hypothetical protein HCR_20060 [Hydrogenimonas cancrithermarum]
MRRIWIFAVVACMAFGGEIRYGDGTFEMEGGFLGLTVSRSTDIESYSLVEQHKNISDSVWYYAYNLTWFDSKRLQQASQSLVTGGEPYATSVIEMPSLDYRFEGFDAEGVVGYDFYHDSERTYAGAGLMFGLSTPWIDSQKSGDSSTDPAYDDLYEKSKTEILTFRVGPSIQVSKALGSIFSIYGSATIGYQFGSVKNDYARTDSNVQGWFDAVDIGLRLQALSYDKDMGWFTLSPRLYATAGFRYTYWQLKDLAVDTSGSGIAFGESDLKMSTSTVYAAIGYAF